jgi:3-deoxy-D-arabino-heptulosonate 7-phosphate (DAHP) synthase class II
MSLEEEMKGEKVTECVGGIQRSEEGRSKVR